MLQLIWKQGSFWEAGILEIKCAHVTGVCCPGDFFNRALSSYLVLWRWKKTVCSYLLGPCNTLMSIATTFKDCVCWVGGICIITGPQCEAGNWNMCCILCGSISYISLIHFAHLCFSQLIVILDTSIY